MQTILFAVMLLLANYTVFRCVSAGKPDAVSSLTAMATVALLPVIVAPRQRRMPGETAVILPIAWVLVLVAYR